ncbi:ABC transporter ATP-binding protein [Clostridiaceae bacterium HSG29]|nr:ABC transporter ATP-binding protein [Clostridiaceae bacterium HSG29]
MSIVIKDLKKYYKVGDQVVKALRGVDLEIKKGEICCILGTSGSGKSTMLNLMAGLEKPTKGEILIKNQDITKMNEKELAKFRQKNVGFVFQSYNLLNALTALENVALPLTFCEIPKKIREKESYKILSKVGLKTHVLHKPMQLSGGQRQRVGIARAFVGTPEIVFADEPTGNLDSKTSEEIMKLILEITAEKNLTLIMVTHNRDLARYADKVVYILDGEIKKVENRNSENDIRRYEDETI